MNFINTIHDMLLRGATFMMLVCFTRHVLNVQERNSMRTSSVRSNVLLERLIGPQLVKTRPSFYETRNYFQEPAICPYPESE
jgi:hypothetical protein